MDTLSSAGYDTQILQDGDQIQAITVTIFLINFGAHMNILLIIKVRIFFLNKW